MTTSSSRPLDLIQSGFAELQLAATPGTLESLAALSELVADWGRRINLTGHRDPGSIARRLVLDAVALQAELPSFGSLADLGSGAGFPGLPIAILRPETRVLLVEARERRHHFQRHAIRELGLENVRAIRGRLEEAPPEPCEAVVAQAVAPPDRLAAWMLRWAKPGALLAVPGGTFPRTTQTAGLREARNDTYQVPLGGPVRTLWTARAA